MLRMLLVRFIITLTRLAKKQFQPREELSEEKFYTLRQAALESYLLKCSIDFLLQQYIDYRIELSIFYYRHPATAKGTITSITKKEYLKVTGDGVSDLFSLITADDRAFLQLKKLQW